MSRRAVALPPLALVSLVFAQTAACVVSESIPGEPRLSSALELRLGEPWIANEDAIPRTGGLEERDDHSFGPGDYGWGTDVVTVTRTADSAATGHALPTCVPLDIDASDAVVEVTVYEGTPSLFAAKRASRA
ncbi:hypothetical protein BMF94_0310 [Rhodotorula taiwanensis]|uniref:Secreted protein n=1 Tax=Rhodotorula taiwanensis TaxID=741276 RepID=A0A2S5BIW8_9BASI|nr:hypothetical protein BMF94_0310 [Rhodotorula taiwanensis]